MADDTARSADPGIYKLATTFLGGVVLTLLGTMATMAHDSIPRAEVDEKIREVVQQMNAQYQGVNGHLENIDRNQVQMGNEIVRIGEHLGVATNPVAPHQSHQ